MNFFKEKFLELCCEELSSNRVKDSYKSGKLIKKNEVSINTNSLSKFSFNMNVKFF